MLDAYTFDARFTYLAVYAGRYTGQPSGWAAIPSHLLKDAFEMQSNPLDNCAAACVCKHWQAAVNNSFIGALHLDMGSSHSPEDNLGRRSAFLRARSTIGRLTLQLATAPGSARSWLVTH